MRSDNTISLPTAFILPKLTSFKKRQQIRKEDWSPLRSANPDYDKPSAIDIVLGTDVYAFLIRDSFRRGRPGDTV